MSGNGQTNRLIMANRASAETVLRVLRKSLPEAGLKRIPRHPERRDVILAILCREMRRRYPYSETEFGDFLKDALAELNAGVDHVSCRRYMVDLGFVRRDRAGTRYLLNYPKLEATLAEEAIVSAKRLIDEALALQRKPARRVTDEQTH